MLVLLRERWAVGPMMRVRGRHPGTGARRARRPRPGRSWSSIGPNGAGKSTLLRALAGLEPGRVRVGERRLDRPRRSPERRVGYVFQDQSLFPHLSALDNVAFGPRSAGSQPREADGTRARWLERFGIGELADRRPRELSGGQAQRVAIARALATDPDVLLLDEPFAGLDVVGAMALRIELGRHLRDFAGIALLVTHDALDALTLADRVLVLDEGRIAQVGPPAEVAARPRTAHVARLVGLNLVARRCDELVAPSPPTRSSVSLAEPERLRPPALAAARCASVARRTATPYDCWCTPVPTCSPTSLRGRGHELGPAPGPGGLAVGQGHRREHGYREAETTGAIHARHEPHAPGQAPTATSPSSWCGSPRPPPWQPAAGSAAATRTTPTAWPSTRCAR